VRRRDSLPTIEPPADTEAPDDGDSAVHGVVLAAGTSSRYGDRNKLLERVDGEPMVHRTARTLLDANTAGVTVVVGYEAASVRAAVSDLDVGTWTNEDYADGQSTSVASGVAAARDRGADAVLVALGDMPAVTVDAVNALIAAYDRTDHDALAAACDGRRGNPVLFDSRYFDALLDVEGDVGGRDILLEEADAVAVETGDPGVLSDVDRPDDL